MYESRGTKDNDTNPKKVEKEKNKSNHHYACPHLAGCYSCAFVKLENVWENGQWRFGKRNSTMDASMDIWHCRSGSLAVLLSFLIKKTTKNLIVR